MNRLRFIAITPLLLACACGEGSVKQKLGLESRAPDAFRVVSRPPLSVPPQFSLYPPTPGENPNNPYAADRQAKALLTGQSPEEIAQGTETFVLKGGNADTAVQKVETNPLDGIAGSSAESQFLRNAGATQADPSVRHALVEERYIRQEEEEESSWWDFWSDSPEKKETTVNPTKEAERIQQNQDEGKPVTEGETPVVNPRDKGIFGHILGN